MRVDQSPFRLSVPQDDAAAVVELTNLSSSAADAQVAYALIGGEYNQPVSARGSGVVRIPLAAPAWVRGVVVDVEMDRGQWDRFTDFGVSVFDSTGSVIAKEPMNYAVSRLKAPLPEQHADWPLEVRLFPGFADSASTQEWKAQVTVRLYSDRPTVLETDGQRTASASLAPGQSKTVRFALARPPGRLPKGFQPLGVAVVHSAGEVWTRETALRSAPSE